MESNSVSLSESVFFHLAKHFRFIIVVDTNSSFLFITENPRDRGAWWAAVYEVAYSRTRLKWLSSSSSRSERLHVPFSLSCIGEGNGNPLQYSCLENPRDGGAWWAAVTGVAQSWTRLKLLSSSNSNALHGCTTVSLSIHYLEGICIISRFWQLWRKPQ